MGSRLAGRLLTSPLAFLLAGVLDVASLVAGAVTGRLSRALPPRARPRRRGSAT